MYCSPTILKRDSPASLLQYGIFPAIIVMKNKNAAVPGCANTRKPAQVSRPPTQRPIGRTAWKYYTIIWPFL